MELSAFILVGLTGFVAQLIDGTLGMGYGVTSTTLLLSMGLSPAVASASVHTAEIFTTLVSGISHLKAGNVDRALVKRLALPGMTCGALGVYILVMLPGQSFKPFVSAYLFVMGVIILRRAMGGAHLTIREGRVSALAAVGGFLDAIGGGGWGPIVTSTLLAGGHNPRFSVGSAVSAEFFVTLAQVATFSVVLGISQWFVVGGLILGGIVAAPFAAYSCKTIHPRMLTVCVGILIVLLSIRNLLTSG